jgi:hypothetical protein
VSIRIDIDTGANLRIVTFEGTIRDVDIIETFGAYWQSPDYDPSLNELYDCSNITTEDISSEGLRKIAGVNLDMNRSGPAVKVAMYAPTDVAFGLIRMYQVFVENSASDLRVFRDRNEALQWLGAAASDA